VDTTAELLSLAFIGWFYACTSAAALALGVAIVLWLHRSGRLGARYLHGVLWGDMVLLAIWILGLAGGLGVLQRESWGRFTLELFCLVLIALTILSAITRIVAQRQAIPDQSRADKIGAIAAALVLVIPVVAMCAATIMTLRNDSAWRAFGG
jgi:hypothetical protein